MLLRPVRGRGDAPGKAVQDVPCGGLPRWIIDRELLLDFPPDVDGDENAGGLSLLVGNVLDG